MQMHVSIYRLLACMAVLVLAGLPGVASADEWDSCVKLSDDLAVAGCSRAIDLHQYTGRSLARLYSRRGGAYEAQGDTNRAIADQNEWMRIDPTYPGAYNNRGNIWFHRGDFDRAIADFSQAIQLDLKYEGRLHQPRQRLGGQGQLRPGHRGLRPGDPARPERGVDAYYSRGRAWSGKGDLDRAIADYSQAIQAQSEINGNAYVNRGSAWGGEGNFDRAFADFDQAIELDPKDAKAYYNRGAAWEKKGSLQAALADFKMHAQLAPSDRDGLTAVKRVSKELRAR